MKRHIRRIRQGLKRALGLDPVYRLFPPRDRDEIERAVRNAKFWTSGEIVVRIIDKCERGLRRNGNASGRTYAQAAREFKRLGIGRTKGKTGVLVLVILAERRFEIIADRGIYEKLPRRFWTERADNLSAHFSNARFADGICAIVREIGNELARFFPREANDWGELINKPVIVAAATDGSSFSAGGGGGSGGFGGGGFGGGGAGGGW